MAGSVLQNTFYVVNLINAILYGVVLVLYYMTIVQIYIIKKRTFMDKFMVVFCTILLILNTIYWATQAYFCQTMWIIHSDYPGGAEAYWTKFQSVWYQTLGYVASVVSNLMSDALLLHRCFVIWNSRRIIILPLLIWIASLTFGVGLLYGTGRPDGDYFGGISVMFVTAYTASTFAFNVVVTALICARIIYVGRYMQRDYQTDTTVYTGAVAIVVESALPFTVFSAAYLISYAIGTDVANGFSFYAMFTCISPLLITLRVLTRRAWTRNSAALFTTTISYRGQTDYVTTDCVEPTEKRLSDFTAVEKLPEAATQDVVSLPRDRGSLQEVDIGSLPV